MPRLVSCLLVVALTSVPLCPDLCGLPALGPAMAQPAQAPAKRGPTRLEQQAEARCGEVQQAPQLIDPPTTAAVPNPGPNLSPSPNSGPNPNPFVARDHFRRTTAPAAAVRITWLGAAFSEHFVPKTEPNHGSSLLRSHTVQRTSRDIEIIAELGTRHETTLGDLWCLLRQQSHGEAGMLRTDTRPNVLYIRSTAGLLFTIDALWGGAGWELGASSAEGFRTEGSLVISR